MIQVIECQFSEIIAAFLSVEILEGSLLNEGILIISEGKYEWSINSSCL